MSEAKHTPGPWVWDNTNRGFKLRSETEPGYFAEIHGACAGAHEKRDANARLIAAAPDLLEAAREAIQDTHDTGMVSPEAIEKLRAAIAKARGKS